MDFEWLTQQSTPDLAKALLGYRLTVDETGGLIVETEAYVGVTDRTAHVFGGKKTAANQALYAPAGTVYVYRLRAYFLMNIITQVASEPQGVLIRAIEPTKGLATMAARRGQQGYNLTSGPGKLAQAMAIDLRDNSTMLNQGRIHLSSHRIKTPAAIESGPRIGVPNKGEWTTAPLRFWVAHNPYVSGMTKQQMNEQTKGWQ
ncbi:DNA-3-methyladenine glycosylase [Lacticaseibacillus brantae]|uniref:Putative 3-methyladenine DNA glycosylase n=1 Tax=Lacticaseibacillus brantae DSM 23927 TaxID=1423727 RepID=A0A0R2B020_9LACO|nr:DNA-3-methyladenine glycosylase [Lacticaseibacillus brantae]KRM72720.1 3-methyladenine DNA glycosylase [Lacticaseibacillus brantae DSM 23927]